MKPTMKPEAVMNFFYELNQIPRGSGNEKAVSDYLVKFAQDRQLKVHQDDVLNVYIYKPASPGYENRPPVILQGHMDMVCVKTAESNHDFNTDPIELIVEGEWLHAKDTTLGADNGIAVAMALAVLDDPKAEHGPLEVLITTAEETNMGGAWNVQGDKLSGRYLLNIDTEEEGTFVVSSAGGVNVQVEIPLLHQMCDNTYTAGLQVTVKGLRGGHSGMEIHKQRANANQVLARTLYELARQYKYQLSNFAGGTRPNVIPSLATATLAVKADDVAQIRALLAKRSAQYREEFTPQDPDLTIEVVDVPVPENVYAGFTTEALLSFLYLAPHGPIGMSQKLPDLVETSLNLGVVDATQGRNVVVTVSLRSSAPMPLHYLSERLLLLAKVLGVKASTSSSYPAWEYEADGALEQQATAVYEKLTGQKPTVLALHAGLECGLLKAALPNTQMISFGPNIEHAHSTLERLHLPSAGRVYTYLLALLKELR